MSPSTHSADVSQIQADTTAILVDTGTTIPATIAAVDTVVDAILVDTGTTLPANITAARNPRDSAGGDVSISSSVIALVDTAMTITCPSTAGKTYTVVLTMPTGNITDAGNYTQYALKGSTLGVGNMGYQSAWGAAGENWSMGTISRGGFVASEVVTLQFSSAEATKLVYIYGAWSMIVYEDA